MKLRDLIQELSEVKTWEKPRVELEQYPTPPDIAAHMLFAAVEEGDVEDSLVADLGRGHFKGCNPGRHSLGSVNNGPTTELGQHAREHPWAADLQRCGC